MHLQNRIDPFGRFHAVSDRGDLMGNRGILHDDRQNVLKTHAHQNWVACSLSFKGRKRQIMAPGSYTELFFHDEASALAAGHRPCATCRRDRYLAFTGAWARVHGGATDGRSLPQTIDRALHKARISRSGEKIAHQADCASLPNGAMFADGTQAFVVWQGDRYRWSFAGYFVDGPVRGGDVSVLTPWPLIAVLRDGYRPQVHESLGRTLKI